jgi:ADP-heptose:LPS heptosyltransferase
MKILVFRMSSLGDLILSTSFLESLPEGVIVDWVVSSEFAFVLKGHPRIRHLVVFDKKEGLRGWIRLLDRISGEDHEIRVDLHRTLRTRLAEVYLFFKDLKNGRSVGHISVSKQRIRTFLLLVFKSLLPRSLHPTPYWKRFSGAGRRISGEGKPFRRPSYLPVLEASGLSEEKVLESYGLKKGAYFCLMPASRWRTKEWGPEGFFALARDLSRSSLTPLVLGREKDEACVSLRKLFQEGGLPFVSALNETDFRVTAILLKNAAFFVGCDTGLFHLSEAVGCKSHVIFGPTRPELGFGPCRENGVSISLPIGCAPCSKDGKHCLRFWSPYECMKGLSADRVRREIQP